MLRSLRQRQQISLKRRWVVRSAVFVLCAVVLATVLIASLLSGAAHSQDSESPASPSPAQIDRFLPPPRLHPLPAPLNQRQATESSSDYFDQIQPTIAGYLIWSRLPVRVYLEPTAPTTGRDRTQDWMTAVTAAIQDWNAYLPLTIVAASDAADIVIWRKAPPLQVDRNEARAPRARSAETRFTLFVDRSQPHSILAHRMTIWLGTNQTSGYLRAAARHELGHALGLWGHSPIATDVMYFAQVRQSPPISDRDLNTLKRLYQQPTRLGWPIPATPD